MPSLTRFPVTQPHPSIAAGCVRGERRAGGDEPGVASASQLGRRHHRGGGPGIRRRPRQVHRRCEVCPETFNPALSRTEFWCRLRRTYCGALIIRMLRNGALFLQKFETTAFLWSVGSSRRSLSTCAWVSNHPPSFIIAPEGCVGRFLVQLCFVSRVARFASEIPFQT